jgi:hypothetical protein
MTSSQTRDDILQYQRELMRRRRARLRAIVQVHSTTSPSQVKVDSSHSSLSIEIPY